MGYEKQVKKIRRFMGDVLNYFDCRGYFGRITGQKIWIIKRSVRGGMFGLAMGQEKG